MATFPAKYFTYGTRYPESGERMRLGRSYLYTKGDPAPDQRVFQLSVQGMQYFVDGQGNLDGTTQPERNMKVLEDFYITHRQNKSFDFEHPVYGTLTCKFNRPLEIPEGVIGADGLLPVFEVELIEIP